MKTLLTLEFWVGVQFFIDLLLVGVIFSLIKRFRRERDILFSTRDRVDPSTVDGPDTSDISMEIMDRLEPLLRDSEAAADQFDESLKEKKRLIKGLNDALDSRIISLNLLLSRADAADTARSRAFSMDAAPPRSRDLALDSPSPLDGCPPSPGGDVFDQQNQILNFFDRGMGIDDIAARLSMPKGEVQLVVDLKKKFAGLEHSG